MSHNTQVALAELVSMLEIRNKARKARHLPEEILTTGKLIELLSSAIHSTTQHTYNENIPR